MRQLQAQSVMLSGQSVFLTGAPGAGKTYILNDFINRSIRRGKRVAVTASTGIAATHIGGTTIHSWSGLGIKDALSDWDLERMRQTDKLVKRYNSTDILVIDEVSMLHGARLDMVNQVCKLLRENPAPFGGLQVVLVGDLFQLPPVSKYGEAVDFAYTSAAWRELSPQICYITEQHRQTAVGDPLLDLLESMRRGDVNELHELSLRERLGVQPDQPATVTRLYSHNMDVDKINADHLRQLAGREYTYKMTLGGSHAKAESFAKALLAPELLKLKEGAEVMFVVNDYVKGFYNGSRGRVVDFENGQPVVELYTGKMITVESHDWSLEEDGKTRATASQLPLRLAWAITIHKSQGMSLDAAIIDLSRSFAPGMGYVALSRVRGMDGVYLQGINNVALALHPAVHEYDLQLRELSEALASITDDAPDEDDVPTVAIQPNAPTLKALKDWRTDRAQKDSMPAYIIAHDKTLEDLAIIRPETPLQLRTVKGFGPKKAETYGPEVLAIIAKHK